MKSFSLNDGRSIPAFGLGTFRLSRAEAENSVDFALRNGYTLIDTANVYMNEEAVGRGIKKSRVKREDIYLISKIFPTRFRDFDKAFEETLDRLQVDYLDLLLLHRPYGNYRKAYIELVKKQKEGKVRSIGVSNFDEKQIGEIIADTGITPVINQVECNPYHAQVKMQKSMADLGILTQAWYPLGSGNKKLFQEKILVDIANKYKKSVPQILIAYLINRGIVAIPGSRSEKHILSNLEAADINLSDEEIALINALSKGEGSPDFLGRFTYRFQSKNYYEKK